MQDHTFVGSCPSEERVVQLGSPNFSSRALAHCVAYRDQLIREFGPPPGTSYLKVKRQEHDFGFFFEVAVFFETENQKEVDYMYTLEDHSPTKWDEKAKKELGII